MNNFEQYLVELLQGNILLDGEIVEVRRQFSPVGHIPCITLDLVSNNTDFIYHRITDGDETHIAQTSDINIHSWCNTEEQRESINNQILQCYHQSIEHHYKYCTQYNKQTRACTTTGNTCGAINGTNISARHNKCPDTERYGYECLTEKHDIGYMTVTIDHPFFSDELGETPPILHSIFKASCGVDELITQYKDSIMNDVEYDDI